MKPRPTWLALLVCALACSEPKGALYRFSVSFPDMKPIEGVERIRFTLVLDGLPARTVPPVEIDGPFDSRERTEALFSARVPRGAIGTLRLDAEGLDRTGCLRAQGSFTAPIQAASSMDSMIRLMTVNPVECPYLLVEAIGNGTGVIKVNDKVCPAPCRIEAPPGSLLHVGTEALTGSFVEGMRGGCSGISACDVVLGSRTPTVRVRFGKRLCLSGGWCWEGYVPQKAPLLSLFGRGPQDLWAAGIDGGSLLRWDGTGWDLLSSGIDDSVFFGVWGPPSGPLIVVGGENDGGMIAQYDGQRWSRHAVKPTPPLLTAVWGSGADVFAVGHDGAILHYDGKDWSTEISGTQRSLVSVWGTGTDNVFAVGNQVITHRRGATWKATPVSGTLRTVWGTSPDRVFAAGDNSVLFQFDGTGWRQIPVSIASESGLSVGLVALWGAPGGPLYLATDAGTVLRYDYDGAPIIEVAKEPIREKGAIRRRYWSSGKDVFAVEGGGRLFHFDGQRFTMLHDAHADRPPPDGLFAPMRWGSPTDLYVTDGNGQLRHFDGSKWTTLKIDGAIDRLNTVWGSGPSDVFAAGQREIWHFDGIAWGPSLLLGETEDVDFANFRVLWGSGPQDVFAGGEGHRVYHYDGKKWTSVPIDDDLVAMWGSAQNRVWAAGAAIWYFDGNTAGRWTRQFRDEGYTFSSLWGSAPNDVYAAGQYLFHFDGTSWTRMKGMPGTRVWGRAKNDIYLDDLHLSP